MKLPVARVARTLAVLVAACCLYALPVAAATPAPAMDRAAIDVRGWAVDTRGGAGGAIVRVSNLNAGGEGSLAAALATDGARIIVFEVGGVIDLQGATLRINKPYVTVAGQTAPHPGITLIRGGLSVSTNDVIVQHIAVRPGENGKPKKGGWEADGLSASGASNLIVDHCSFSWATDENLSASGPRFNGNGPDDWPNHTSRRVTYSHNIIAEGLRDSTHAKGEHSKGTLIHDNAEQILLYGNLYTSNVERNPLVKGGAKVAFVNNLIHNPGKRAVHYNLIAHEWGERAPRTGAVTIIGNVLRGGPDTGAKVPLFSLGGVGDVSLFMQDNIAVDANGEPLPMTGRYTADTAKILTTGQPYLPAGLAPLPANGLESAIYASAGMRPWQRDAVDFKILSDVAEGRGHIVDSEAQSSGYPNYAPTRKAFVAGDWNLADMSPKAGWQSLATRRP
ncbi:pectate lyase [Massilia sp. Root351]|uniref:pectate lyase family protein n=1 Tax=Massilia sp. Root351 TaxID=1736522 RepID=UPI00070B6E3F|nr:pectate lyase [Massilia sp. Root351]KQV85916.1 pectate lyase [Massilia sp. Root351]